MRTTPDPRPEWPAVPRAGRRSSRLVITLNALLAIAIACIALLLASWLGSRS